MNFNLFSKQEIDPDLSDKKKNLDDDPNKQYKN